MSRAFVLLTFALLCVGVGACGRSSATPDRTVQADAGAEEITKYGQQADGGERQAILALVSDFYRAAAADDGARACSLIYSVMAEEIPAVYGRSPGPPSLRGATCAAVMAKLFRRVPGQPANILATTEVTGVRVKGRRGIALLRSRGLPAGYLPVERELGSWRVAALIGNPLPGMSQADGGAGSFGSEVTTGGQLPSSASAPKYPGRDAADGDDDGSANDDWPVLNFGHAADASQRHAIAATVGRFYSAAAGDDGARACETVYAVTAEAIPEDYAQTPGLQGAGCAGVLSKVFAREHHKLLVDATALKVGKVRVQAAKALAFVFLGSYPEPYVELHQQGAAWKMQSLRQIGLP
ncbi:MAG TPA: hypothetical protein VFW38_11420 [Solirubrobacteraceae bacterium]|nr:hypothetical protein [Solirubrobacteraceae bacterium]